jgi:hypothetical protein
MCAMENFQWCVELGFAGAAISIDGILPQIPRRDMHKSLQTEPFLPLSPSPTSLSIREREHDPLFSPSVGVLLYQTGHEQEGKEEKGTQKILF